MSLGLYTYSAAYPVLGALKARALRESLVDSMLEAGDVEGCVGVLAQSVERELVSTRPLEVEGWLWGNWEEQGKELARFIRGNVAVFLRFFVAKSDVRKLKLKVRQIQTQQASRAVAPSERRGVLIRDQKLEAARTLGRRLKSLTLIEPVSFHLLRLEHGPEWVEIERLGLTVLGAVARGEHREAARIFMSYWLGRFRWWISPERFKQAIAATIPKVALEFSIALSAQTTLSDYAKITVPTALIVGSKTRKPARAVVNLLGGALPNAQVEILKGAGHMSPFTHPTEVDRLVLDHLAAQS